MKLFKLKRPEHFIIFILLLINVIERGSLKTYPPSLEGHHLVFGLVRYDVLLDITRNASGYIVNTTGIASPGISWLAQRLKFTYSFLQVSGFTVDPKDGFPGMASYLINKEIDSIPGTMYLDASRSSRMDYVAGYFYSPFVLLIQRPDAATNIASLIKPFQLLVWILLIVAIPLVISAHFVFNNISNKPKSNLNLSDKAETRKKYSVEDIKIISIYVFGILFSQGGHYRTERNSVLVVAGTWCLSAFVLGSAYNSLLTSYIMRPNIQPLIESYKDVANTPYIFPVFDKGNAIDKMMMSAKSGLYKLVGDKLRSNTKLRCTLTQDCIEMVKNGPYAYGNLNYVVMKIMLDDYLATNQCSLEIAKQSEYAGPTSWAFYKNSPYKELISIGLDEMYEFGFVKIWTKWNQADPKECLDEIKKSRTVGNQTRLTLKNLTGAFIVLAVGYVAALVVFTLEKITFRFIF